jgi:hypothetical protein
MVNEAPKPPRSQKPRATFEGLHHPKPLSKREGLIRAINRRINVLSSSHSFGGGWGEVKKPRRFRPLNKQMTIIHTKNNLKRK